MPTNVSPFQLPLSIEEFRTALQKGQGRALLHVMHHGPSGFEQLILEACLHNQAHDPQCEGDRAEWMIEIMESAGILEAMQPQILSGSGVTGSGSDWDQNQQCQLALIFARRGRSEFRSHLYAAFHKCGGSADLIAGEEIIELDGADGLLFVAERAGQWIADDPETYGGDFLTSFYDWKHGRGAAERILRSVADQNPLIASYLDHLDSEKEGDLEDSELKRGRGTINLGTMARFVTRKKLLFDGFLSWSADDVIREIETTEPSENRHRYVYESWGRHASEQELRKVAEALFAEKDGKRIFLYLRVFQSCGLPEMDPRLLILANSEDRETRWIAYRVLANHEHPAVRSLAIDRLSEGKLSEGELLLLHENYQPGDWSLVERAIRLPDDQSDLLDVFEYNASEESFYALMLVYDRSPSGNCRHRAVKALIDLGQVPGWLLEECRFDVNEATRKSVSDVSQ